MSSNRSHPPDHPMACQQSTKVRFTSRQVRGTAGRVSRTARVVRPVSREAQRDGRGQETRYHRRVIRHASRVSRAPWTATSNETLKSDRGRSRPMRSSKSELLYIVPHRASRPVAVDCDRGAQRNEGAYFPRCVPLLGWRDCRCRTTDRSTMRNPSTTTDCLSGSKTLVTPSHGFTALTA